MIFVRCPHIRRLFMCVNDREQQFHHFHGFEKIIFNIEKSDMFQSSREIHTSTGGLLLLLLTIIIATRI